jgi:hypothetical protein
MSGDEQTRTNIHALSGIRTHSLSVQAIKACASDGVATGTAWKGCSCYISSIAWIELTLLLQRTSSEQTRLNTF